MVKPVIVIGAGICGISTAIWLQRSNFEVLLLDKAKEFFHKLLKRNSIVFS